jgi:hypothetical protein
MLHIHNASGTLPDDVLLRELTEQVPAPVRDRLEAWHDAHESLEAECDAAREAGAGELEPYREAWDALFATWEDCCADGYWPGAGPADPTLLSVMGADMVRGARALAAVHDVLSDLQKPGAQRRNLAAVRAVLAAALQE